MKKSVSDVKEKFMKLFQTNAYNSIFKDWKPEKVSDAFNDKNIESGKNLSIEQYLEKIKPFLCNMIDELKKSGEWKTMKFNFMLSKNNDDKQVMYSKNDSIEFMIGSKTDEIINELSESLLIRHQLSLEESMKGSDNVFDSINGMCYKCNKRNLNHSGLYINFPDWVNKQKSNYNLKK